jgi:hypothetical protein
LPLRWDDDPEHRVEAHLIDLLNGLTNRCADAGLLRDVADLVPEVFGPDAAEPARRLRLFADFHAAEDQAAYLQRCDPDLATAIRRIWLDRAGADAD